MEEQIKQANPNLHRYLFTVTTFSKLLAMFLFIVLPFVGFYLGMKYQEKVTVTTPTIPQVQKSAIPTSTIIPIDTSNWKTYSNTKTSYSFKYPANLYFYTPRKASSSAGFAILDYQVISTAPESSIDIDGVPAGDYLDFYVEDNSSNQSIKDWVKKELELPIKLTDITINGIAWKHTYDFPFFIGGEAYFTEQNGKIYWVAWYQVKKDLSDNIFKNILSSFSFK
jgi:hypothetical protein